MTDRPTPSEQRASGQLAEPSEDAKAWTLAFMTRLRLNTTNDMLRKCLGNAYDELRMGQATDDVNLIKTEDGGHVLTIERGARELVLVTPDDGSIFYFSARPGPDGARSGVVHDGRGLVHLLAWVQGEALVLDGLVIGGEPRTEQEKTKETLPGVAKEVTGAPGDGRSALRRSTLADRGSPEESAVLPPSDAPLDGTCAVCGKTFFPVRCMEHHPLNRQQTANPSPRCAEADEHAMRWFRGHDAPCFYCDEPCNSYAGDPGRWPVGLYHAVDPGVLKWHHTACIQDRLAAALVEAACDFPGCVYPDRHPSPHWDGCGATVHFDDGRLRMADGLPAPDMLRCRRCALLVAIATSDVGSCPETFSGHEFERVAVRCTPQGKDGE